MLHAAATRDVNVVTHTMVELITIECAKCEIVRRESNQERNIPVGEGAPLKVMRIQSAGPHVIVRVEEAARQQGGLADDCVLLLRSWDRLHRPTNRKCDQL